MIVVSDTTPLSGLAVIGRLGLLRLLFGRVFIAPAVEREALARSPGRFVGQDDFLPPWIRIVPVDNRSAVDLLLDELHIGEAETIVLAGQLHADLVLMDEKKGRRKLGQSGLPKMGTVGVLLQAKEAGFLATVRPDLESLRRYGFSVSQAAVDAALRQANE